MSNFQDGYQDGYQTALADIAEKLNVDVDDAWEWIYNNAKPEILEQIRAMRRGES